MNKFFSRLYIILGIILINHSAIANTAPNTLAGKIFKSFVHSGNGPNQKYVGKTVITQFINSNTLISHIQGKTTFESARYCYTRKNNEHGMLHVWHTSGEDKGFEYQSDLNFQARTFYLTGIAPPNTYAEGSFSIIH